MIQIETDDNNNIIYATCTGKLTAEDISLLLPVAEQKIDRFGSIRWYLEVDDLTGWESGTAWKDIKFDMKYAEKYEKVAVTGEKKWNDLLTQLVKPFYAGEVKFFDSSKKEQAKEWVKA